MKKNGFTLVELIVSISLLALIGISIGISLNKTFKNREKTEYETYVNKVVSSANVYLSGNSAILNSLETNKGFIIIKVKELINAGLLDSSIKDPTTGNNIDPEADVKILLDDAGTIKMEFPIVETTDDYIEARNIVVKIGKDSSGNYNNVDPYEGINTLSLRYIKANGDVYEKYLVREDNIICTNVDEISNIDVTKIGSYTIKYKYKLVNGSWKTATRKILVVDGIPPVISNISYSNTSWTNKNLPITYDLSDNDALNSYCLSNKNDCSNCAWENKDKNSKSIVGVKTAGIKQSISKNGTYYICAKDATGNIAHAPEVGIKIDKVDTTKPIINVTSNQGTSYSESFTNTIVMKDDDSGLIGYATGNNCTTVPTSWATISGQNVTKTDAAKSNKTYYYWVKDVAGNTACNSITINKIAQIKTTTVSNSGLYNSSVSGVSHYISGMKEYISGYATTGTFDHATQGGSNLYVYGTAEMYSISYDCSYNATPESSTASCSSYYCPNGGKESNGFCYAYASLADIRSDVGYTYYSAIYSVGNNMFSVRGSCNCANGSIKVDQANGIVCSNYDCLGLSSYKRTRTTYLNDKHSITTKEDDAKYIQDHLDAYSAACKEKVNGEISVYGDCTFSGPYAATCSSESCPAGATYNNGNCYKCSQGTFDGTSCYISSFCNQTLYQYAYSISYWG